VGAALTLRATADGAATAEPSVVHISPAVRIVRVELALDRGDGLTSRSARFSGVVVTDSTREPIIGAEVSLPDAGKTAVTDGRGTFSIAGIPAGEHRIRVRRIGFGAADARLTFGAGDSVYRRVVLGRAITLETVTVSEKRTQREMPGFDDNRRLGLGQFMTRAELARYDGMKLAGVLQQLSGVAFVNGSTGSAWLTSKRAPAPLCPPGPVGDPDHPTQTGRCFQSHGFYIPERQEASRGIKAACYALVYLDGMLMNGAKEPTEPFDVNSIAPEQIEAMEFYAGPSQTPLEYSRMGSNCGVLVIWRRRSS
jgi:hypothetical protein